MDLSNEQIKMILDEAPEGATHYDSFEHHRCYLWDNAFAYYCTESSSWCDSHALNVNSEYLNKKKVLNLLDLRKQLDEVEWENGDECVISLKSKSKWFVVGVSPVTDTSTICTSETGELKSFHTKHLKKPETEAEKLKRERLESAYELYCIMCAIEGYAKFDLTSFSKAKKDSAVWLAIVDKTKYRKGE